MNKFLLRKPDTLSEISRDVAQVFFAAMVVGPLLQEKPSLFIILYGFGLSVWLWYMSIQLATS